MGQEVYITNFSHLEDDYVNLYMCYICNDGKPVQIETMGQVDHQYHCALVIIKEALKHVLKEAHCPIISVWMEILNTQ